MQRLAEKPVQAAWANADAGEPQPAMPTPAGSASTRPLTGARLRVLHVINRLDTGGTEHGVLKLMEGLDHNLFEHRLCTTRGFDPHVARLHNLEEKVYVAGRNETRRQFAVFRLARIMRAYRPCIVHSRNWGAIEAIPAARLAGVPVVVHSEHGYEVDMLAGLPRRRRLLRRAFYAMADSVFTVTEELRAYHAGQAWVSPQKIRVLYNGVDTRRFAPHPEVRARVREQLGLSAGSFVVGTVGRLVPIKDHPTLLKAAEALIRGGANVSVLLVGAGSERARLEQLVENSPNLRGHVVLAGAAENVPDLLNAMDVFVLPSLCEGMSNTLLEAMASGLPVMATRVGGNPELVQEDQSGWLFAPGDVSNLAAGLLRLADSRNLRCAWGTAARLRAVTQFGLDQMLERYRNLYVELARGRGIPAQG